GVALLRLFLHRRGVIEDLLKTLQENGIEPMGAEGLCRNIHVEQRRYAAFPLDTGSDNTILAQPKAEIVDRL
ncbi:MAG: hypothetical protein L0Y39_06160, partial [Methylococcaceae bacterium]|nr:hypothetical protein [Methylococcaceae bacterium]